MKLKNPVETRVLLEHRGKGTITSIAEELSMSTHTISKLLKGQSVQYRSVKKLADYLETDTNEIAEVAS